MKKYKLIKWYPTCLSLKEGQIVTEWTGSTCYSLTRSSLFFSPSEVENNPGFWQEVVEKDYEILSIKCKYSSSIHSPDNIIYHDVNCDCYNYYKMKDCFYIHSVKRLSDGEVFTVGDKIEPLYGSEKTKIKSLEIKNDDVLKIQGLNYHDTAWSIQRLKHIKKPLFTTEDGVDIFEGDKYFELALTYKPAFREAIYEEKARPNIFYNYGILEKKQGLNKNGRYYFSTKEAAEEYILMDKPCLSINDILHCVPKLSPRGLNIIKGFVKLKKL